MSSCHTISRKTFLLPDDFLFSDRSACFSNEFYCPSFTPDCLGICGLKQLIHRRSRKNCVDFFTKVFWHDCRVYARWMQRERERVALFEIRAGHGFPLWKLYFSVEFWPLKRRSNWKIPRWHGAKGVGKRSGLERVILAKKVPRAIYWESNHFPARNWKDRGNAGARWPIGIPGIFASEFVHFCGLWQKGRRDGFSRFPRSWKSSRKGEIFTASWTNVRELGKNKSRGKDSQFFPHLTNARLENPPENFDDESRERSSAPFGTRFNLSTRTNSWDFSRSKLKEFSRI